MNTPRQLYAIVAALLLTCALVPASASAAKVGNVDAGKQYAEAQCAACHSIVPDGNMSPRDAATPFQAIADTGGMTATALHVFFQTPHPNMPNLIVQGDDEDNIIAYILSLKSKR